MNRKEKLRDKFKMVLISESPWIIAISVVALSCVLIVHIMFKFSAPIPFLSATWESGDLLSFLGSIIGAAATIYVLRKTIKTTVSRQKEEHAYLIRPYIMADFAKSTTMLSAEEQKILVDISESNKEKGWNGNYDISIRLINVGAGSAVDVNAEIYQADNLDTKYSRILPPLMIGNSYYFRLQHCHAKPICFNVFYVDIANINHYKAEMLLELTVTSPTNIYIKCNVPKIKLV